jgi:uncharacterized protein (TIGR03437 family)
MNAPLSPSFGRLAVLAIACTMIHGQATIQTVAGGPFHFPASTIDLGAPLGQIAGVAADGAGNIYASDASNQIVVKLSLSGALTVLAGAGAKGFSGEGGPATASTVPAINAGGVTIGAGFQPGFAPGSLISIFGTNFAAAPTSASGSPLPTTLGGVQVLVNNQAAPLFFVNGTQINVQAPFELVAGTPATITVIANGSASAPVTVPITAEQPGIFILGSFGNQGTILLAGTGTLAMPVTPGIPSAPAQAGDYLSIFCTGLGATTPFVPTNTVSPGSPPATVNNAVTAIIGGLPATVSFAGLAPGFIGLYQVNVQVPLGVAGNAVALFLTQGGVPSNVATIAVQ